MCLRRHPLIAQSYSRYAVRFAGGLPDWNSSPEADPAASPFDLPQSLSQAPGDTDSIVAHAASPAQDDPVGAAVSLIDGLHTFTGLPWWATVAVTALGIANTSAVNG